jgi:hypothetical protein
VVVLVSAEVLGPFPNAVAFVVEAFEHATAVLLPSTKHVAVVERDWELVNAAPWSRERGTPEN